MFLACVQSKIFVKSLFVQKCIFPLVFQIFYMPLALAVPPSIFCVHAQFSMLYQFWIHTEIVRSLGPLEYIFNTPSHHRVHHGNLVFVFPVNMLDMLEEIRNFLSPRVCPPLSRALFQLYLKISRNVLHIAVVGLTSPF